MEIIVGWKNDAFPTPEILALAEERANICAGCPLNIDNECSDKLEGEVIRDFTYQGNDRKQGDIVKGCGCPLSKKTKSPKSKCPRGAWPTDNG